MRVWIIFSLVIVAIVGTFTVANWAVLTAPTTIHLLLADVSAPLGITMLGAMAGLALLFLIFLVWLETRTLTELGRSRRQPADATAGPQIAELRTTLERGLSELRAAQADAAGAVTARLAELERVVTQEMRQPVRH
jgi:hypothetical protein